MLNREDMIALIRAEEAFNRLNDRIIALTGGYGIDNEEYDGFYELYEVIRRNSRFSESDDYDEDMLRAVVNAINKTPEEKYELLKRSEWDDTDNSDEEDDEL